MRTHVYPLDAVRFLAALSVLAFHLAFYDWASQGTSTLSGMFDGAAAYPILAPFTWFGWVGVQVFFVISGFVIANSANNASPMAFAKSRVLRLYPAVWVCAVISLGAWLFIDNSAWEQLRRPFVHSMTLWINRPWIDGVYWSLAVEMIFYAYIFLLLLSGRFARLPWAAWALLTGSGAYLLVLFCFGETLWQYKIWRLISENADLLLLRYGVFFALGIWMWLASMRAAKPQDWVGVALAIVCCCFEMLQRAADLASGELRIAMAMPPVTPIAIWLVAVGLMFVFTRDPQRFAPRSLRAQTALKQLGSMTYPLYLIHAVVGAGLIRVLVGAGADRWSALAIAVAIVLALAFLVARIAEPDVRKLLRAGWEWGEGALRRAPAFSFLFKPGGAVAAP